MEDEEANRFSARAARYARVGANVGGVAARIAGARLLGGGGGLGAIARRPQGAGDEGRPDDGERPRSSAARLCPGKRRAAPPHARSLACERDPI